MKILLFAKKVPNLEIRLCVEFPGILTLFDEATAKKSSKFWPKNWYSFFLEFFAITQSKRVRIPGNLAYKHISRLCIFFGLNKFFQNLKLQNLEQNFKIFCRNWWRFFNKSCPLWCREYENNSRFLGELSWVCHVQGLTVLN